MRIRRITPPLVKRLSLPNDLLHPPLTAAVELQSIQSGAELLKVDGVARLGMLHHLLASEVKDQNVADLLGESDFTAVGIRIKCDWGCAWHLHPRNRSRRCNLDVVKNKVVQISVALFDGHSELQDVHATPDFGIKQVARQAVIFGSEFHGLGDGGAVGQDPGERDGAFTGEEAVDAGGPNAHGRRVRSQLEDDSRVGWFEAPHVPLGSAVFPAAVHVPVEAGAFAAEECLVRVAVEIPGHRPFNAAGCERCVAAVGFFEVDRELARGEQGENQHREEEEVAHRKGVCCKLRNRRKQNRLPRRTFAVALRSARSLFFELWGRFWI